MKNVWELKLNNELQIYGHFGHNTEISKSKITKYCKKLEKLGCQIEVEDYYTLILDLPNEDDKCKAVLLFILTNVNHSLPSSCYKKKNKLTLCWHF